MREEHRTSLERGIGTAVVGGALAFFTLWPTDPAMKQLVSATAVAALTPLAAFFGLGVADARRNDSAGAP